MNISLVLHSQSGHTARLARAVSALLREQRHDVDIELLRPSGVVKFGTRHVQFRRLPDIEKADLLIVASPVWGFDAAPVIVSYLDTVEQLRGTTPRVHGPFRLVKYAHFLLREVFPGHDALCRDEGDAMAAHVAGDADAAGRLASCRGRVEAFMTRAGACPSK